MSFSLTQQRRSHTESYIWGKKHSFIHPLCIVCGFVCYLPEWGWIRMCSFVNSLTASLTGTQYLKLKPWCQVHLWYHQLVFVVSLRVKRSTKDSLIIWFSSFMNWQSDNLVQFSYELMILFSAHRCSFCTQESVPEDISLICSYRPSRNVVIVCEILIFVNRHTKIMTVRRSLMCLQARSKVWYIVIWACHFTLPVECFTDIILNCFLARSKLL